MGGRLPRGAFVACALGLVGVVTAAAVVVFSLSASPSPGSAVGSGSSKTVADLPEPLRFAVSRELGANDERFRFVRAGGSWSVESNGLTTSVGAAGTVVSASGWSWGLRLRVGSTACAGCLQASPLRSSGNELRVSRGGVEEWWVAGPLGVQQGWTVAARPANGLVLRFDEVGSARARVDSAARLDLGGGRSFEGLHAVDADGNPLPARFVRDADGLVIRVDDRGAVYPVTVDPWVQQAILTASDAASSDYLGASVAVSGDTVVVGAPYAESGSGLTEQGHAYVFTKPSGSAWVSTSTAAILTASDAATSDGFGWSVAVSADTVVVGAYEAESGSGLDAQGHAYVFTKPGGGWTNMTETALLTASDAASDDYFGLSVAVSGDSVVVGAPEAESGSGLAAQGHAYVLTLGANDGFLSGLSVSGASLSPGFSAGTTGYAVRVRGSSVTVSATPASGASAQARVNSGAWGALRALPLNTGRNTVELLVTAADGSIRTYTITVTREPSRAGYCLAGRFLDLEYGQPDTDPVYRGVTPAWFVDGKGITCDTPPYGYILDGKAAWTKGVPAGLYPYYRAK